MKNRYSILSCLKLGYYVLRTKLISRRSRIIRFPAEIRGREYIDFGCNLTTGVRCRLEAFSKDKSIVMRFGNNVQLNDQVHITAMSNVLIGNNVLMASNIYISDCTHGFYSGNEKDSNPKVPPIMREYDVKNVIIEDNVWLGEGCCVLPGVIIGKGSIIGANSVVCKSIPPYVIAVGSPARPIKRFDFSTNKWTKI